MDQSRNVPLPNSSQTSPFSSAFPQTQSALGSGTYGCLTCGYPSTETSSSAATLALGNTRTPLGVYSAPPFDSGEPFSASSTPSFESSIAPASGSNPAFGQSNFDSVGSSFGLAPSTFGAQSSSFGTTVTFPAFGSAATPALGKASTALGVSNPPLSGSGGPFNASSTTSFESSVTPAFGASGTWSLSFGSTPALGESNSASVGSSFVPTPYTFGAQSSSFGTMATFPAFGSAENLALGNTSTPLGVSSSPPSGSRGPFNASSIPNFGSSTTPGFGASTTQSLSFGVTPAFRESNSTSVDSSFELTPSTIGAQSSSFGTTATFPAFGFASTLGLGNRCTPLGVSSSPPSGFGGPFNASSTPTSGSSVTPAFGASGTHSLGFGSTPAFGQSNSFSVASIFGSIPSTFGAQSSPFGPPTFPWSTTTLALGNTNTIFNGSSASLFGSGAFNTSSTFSFGSTPALGQSNSASVGSSFGTNPFTFGSQSAPFATTMKFSVFGSTTTPSFGNTGTPYGGSNASLFGSQGTFNGSSTPSFGYSSTPAFSAWSTSSLSFGSTPALFDQSNSSLGDSTIKRTSSPFGVQSCPLVTRPPTISAFGSATNLSRGNTGTPFAVLSSPQFGCAGVFRASSTSTFGSFSSPVFGASAGTTWTLGSNGSWQSGFGGQCHGTRVAGYTGTVEIGGGNTTQAACKLESISAMPVYSNKSREDLRWEDYQMGRTPFGAQMPLIGATRTVGTAGIEHSGFGGQRLGSRVAGYTRTAEVDGDNSAQPWGKLESISGMRVYENKSHDELRWEDYQLEDKGLPNPACLSAVGVIAKSHGQTTSVVGKNYTSCLGQSKLFCIPSTRLEGIPKGSRVAGYIGTAEVDGGNNTHPSGKLASISGMPVYKDKSHEELRLEDYQLGDKGRPNPACLSAANVIAPSHGRRTFVVGQNSTSCLGQSKLFCIPSARLEGITQGSGVEGYIGTAEVDDGNSKLVSISGMSVYKDKSHEELRWEDCQLGDKVPSRFDGLMSQDTVEQLSTSQSAVIMQVVPFTNSFGSLPSMPQLSNSCSGSLPVMQHGISSMPVTQKLAPASVPSLLDSRYLLHRRNRLLTRKYQPESDRSKVPFFNHDESLNTPEENAFSITRENPRGSLSCPVEHCPSSAKEQVLLKDTHIHLHQNRDPAENVFGKEQINLARSDQGLNLIHNNDFYKKESSITPTGNRAGERGVQIEAQMPKLRHSDYYTEPQIEELAAKERAEPGFCRHVKDFVVGRRGFGSIKFIGDTDVRGLDLESVVHFNSREVIVYMNNSKKPFVEKCHDKPAEVTLVNVMCFDKKTGQRYTEGPKVEKYKQMLMKNAKEKGAEYVSYDPVKGEWKFRVKNLNVYNEEDDVEVGLDLQALKELSDERFVNMDIK